MDKLTEGQRLKKLILDRGFSVYSFANELDVSVQKVQNWITRDSVAKNHLVNVSDKLGVTTDFLLKGK